MTIDNPSNVAPSTLCDLIAHVQDMLSAAGLKVPVQVGAHFFTSNQGSPPKIVFAPETGPGRLAPAIAMGKYAASMVHSCQVLIREKPGQGEANRFQHVYALLDKVVAAIQIAGTGRLEWGQVSDASLTTSDGGGGGCGIQFSFTFRREIPFWDPLWSLANSVDGNTRPIQTAVALSDYSPLPPVDESSTLVADGATITATVTPKEG